MALPDGPGPEPPLARHGLWHRVLGKTSPPPPPVPLPQSHHLEPVRPPITAHVPRKVVTGLPRAQTFTRQQSEQRMHLAPVTPSADERRTSSVDRRAISLHKRETLQSTADQRASAPVILAASHDNVDSQSQGIMTANDSPIEPLYRPMDSSNHPSSTGEQIPAPDIDAMTETQSTTTSQHEAMINDELEKTWILNLSMHFRDQSKREKFFVTYRENEQLWRRVTVSLDYRLAPPNSLEMDLLHTRYQREKSARIYEAIRESLPDIKFYETVTNLKLETTDGRLHVHVVEDGNEIIHYPSVSQVRHLGCRRIRERDIVFDSHMSGFVYKVSVYGRGLIKKEIPSQDTIDEFLYEVNALNSLRYSRDVVEFYGVVVDDCDESVKGLLISYASQGALIDIVYEHCMENGCNLSWASKAKWARQIVQGLADIHESGFVQGDFTLSNIVIDDAGDAKIIDINRRGCPVGWEPPEATALLDAGHRITMYIGVKSDLFQLGMVLWGLAVEEDEPETHGRPLLLGAEVDVPDWYRRITETCLDPDPRMRLQASSLLQLFPPELSRDGMEYAKTSVFPIDDGPLLSRYQADEFRSEERPLARTVEHGSEWPYSCRTYVGTSPVPYELQYPSRGRSPPSPRMSDLGVCEVSRGMLSKTSWAANTSVRPSYTDIGDNDTVSIDAHDYGYPTLTPTVDDEVSGEQGSTEMGATDYVEKPRSAATLLHQHTAGGTVTAHLEEAMVAPDEQGDAAATPRAATAPRLEQTAFSASLPEPRRDAGAAGLMCAASRTRQWTSDARKADDVQGNSSRGDEDESLVAYAAGDMQDTKRKRFCGEGIAGQKTAMEEGEDEAAGVVNQPEYVAVQTGRGTNVCRKDLPWAMAGAAPRSGIVPGDYGLSSPADGPRHMALPVSLTGVGAAHMGIDDELMREKSVIDDDFGVMMQRPRLPTLLMTTEHS